MSASTNDSELEAVEIKLLLEGIYQYYGFDFRDYASTSMRRRVWNVIEAEGLNSISGLQDRLLHDPGCMERFLLSLTVNVTAMFRDPTFYLSIREKVIPLLRTYPFIRIWHAGCSTGEEVYSMAILLKEEGLYDKCRLYATDMNEAVLKRAKSGIFPMHLMRDYTTNYIQSGGQSAFSRYYTAKHDSAIFDHELKKNVIFAHHNLVVDRSFNEFNLIMCRNVMIYFNHALQARVLNLFHDSLPRSGILALGTKESLKLSSHMSSYEELDQRNKIYRKVA